MKARMTELESAAILFEESFPEDFRSPAGISEKKSQFSHRLGSMSVSETWFEGILINYGDVRIAEEMNINVEIDTPVIEMHFSLEGNTEIKFAKPNALPAGFTSAEHNIIYTPPFNGSLQIKPSLKALKFFEIHLTEDFFDKLVIEECNAFSTLAKKIERKEIAALSKGNLGITVKMRSIINDMMNCKRKGSMQRIYLESKVLELLMLQAEQFAGSSGSQKQFRLQPGEVEKLHHVKWFLEQNLDVPHSLQALCRRVGLNEYKLKRGFKEIWGTTIFGYLHQLRMEQARVMLMELGRTVGEVADHAGYKHPHHFTAAFKKHFGRLPRELKQHNMLNS